ncbi:hypothetical protein [Micromonospora sp. U21]|jgi:hypothetical protein|uniref:hypothetical protein n=1 Tax=Micromonospora sp. U21 TaxID=2824899 RepID=UPI001FFDBAFD|nr:hypothetical protein [Micromonospora sp. U21]
MNWTDRIVDATGWRQEPIDGDGGDVESELGATLPTDYQELCRRFGPGSFSAYLYVLPPTAEQGSTSLLGTWQRYRQDNRQGDMIEQFLAPYGLYEPDRGPGLIRWASDQTEGEYFWLADRSADVDRWPVIARKDPLESWHRFDVSTTEFVYRLLADPEFKPFTVADPPGRAFFLPAGQTISSAEEWDALTSPNR